MSQFQATWSYAGNEKQKVSLNSIQQEATENLFSLLYAKYLEANKFLKKKKILWLQVAYNLVSVIHTSIGKQQR